MHVFARRAKFPWGSLWKHLRSVPQVLCSAWLSQGLGALSGRQPVLSASGAGRLVCPARISLHSLPPAQGIKTCTLFVLAQCINSVLQKAGGEPAFKGRGMQLTRKWKQNSGSWKHEEQDKRTKHLYRLHPKSSCDTACATQHLHVWREGSPCSLPFSSIYQPTATLSRAKERLGPQGNTRSCSEKGAGVIPGWHSTQWPRGCAPAALSSPDRTKASAAGKAPRGTQVWPCFQARQWKTSALERVWSHPQTSSSQGQAHTAVLLLSWQCKCYAELLLGNGHVGFWHRSNPTWQTKITLTRFLSACSGFKLLLQGVFIKKHKLILKKNHSNFC